MEPISTKTAPWMWVLIVVGTIALFAGVSADLGGFFGGMLQGAGFAVAVLGAYFLGMLHGGRQATAEGGEPEVWLPSRDHGH